MLRSIAHRSQHHWKRQGEQFPCKVDRRPPSFSRKRHISHSLERFNRGLLCRTQQTTARSLVQSPVTLIVGGFAIGQLLFPRYDFFLTGKTQCEDASLLAPPSDDICAAVDRIQREAQSTWSHQLYRAWRMLWRCCKLAVTLAPIAAFFPILVIQQNREEDVDAQDIVLMLEQRKTKSPWVEWYLRTCLHCVEASGAAVIKFMQWAGSRPDVFGYEFCAVFSELQDNTTPHPWEFTEKALREAYGDDWREKIDLDHIPIGSGCIGQVYKGKVTTIDGQTEHVAVKVLHPNVQRDIDADLDLMRTLIHFVDKMSFLYEPIQWFDLPGCVEEFAHFLTLQTDLRTEAANLQRFNENFKKEEHVRFPQLVDGYEPTKDVLVENFIEGVPILKFARENKENRKMLSDMCFKAVRCVCKMIFLDNFIHGDLHPGNVFVSPDGKDFILLDVGIVAEYSDSDHEAIVDILSSFIRREGRKAGQFMIADSNRRRGVDHAVDEERFVERISKLTTKASDPNVHLMENLGTYISEIFDAAATHHILMNAAFVSAAFAVKVQEGIALALDPSLQMWKVATPIIVESERRRKGLIKSATHVLGYDKWVKDLMSKEKCIEDGKFTHQK